MTEEIYCPMKTITIDIPDYPGCDEYIQSTVEGLIYNTKKSIRALGITFDKPDEVKEPAKRGRKPKTESVDTE